MPSTAASVTTSSPATHPPMAAELPVGAARRMVVIALTAFLTVVDLFATQAILPSLTRAYGVDPAQMSLAVNASTFGMAVASLAVAFFSRKLDRRRGILLSLTALSVPTLLLAFAPGLASFAALRVTQGLLMACAFTLTLAYLGENCSATDTAGAFAAYITGNVASNLFGRLIAAAVADHFGLAANFVLFACLNLAGAVLVYFTIRATPPMPRATCVTPSFAAGARADRDRHDDARLRLFRLPAVRPHNSARRQGRGALRHASGAMGRARSGCGRLADASRAHAAAPDPWPWPRRGRHLLRPGDRDGVRRPRRHG
jgi:MFS family permease